VWFHPQLPAGEPLSPNRLRPQEWLPHVADRGQDDRRLNGLAASFAPRLWMNAVRPAATDSQAATIRLII
jgi:hypothetical protein